MWSGKRVRSLAVKGLSVSASVRVHGRHRFRIGSFAWLILCCSSVNAEFRLWEGDNGSSIEAEYLTQKSGQVSLRMRNGKIVKVPVGRLSANDRAYLQAQDVPEVNVLIDREDTFLKPHSVCDQIGFKCIVEVAKKDDREYPYPLTARLFVLGVNRSGKDPLRLLEAKEWSWIALAEGEFNFKAPFERLWLDRADSRSKSGFKVAGAVLVVSRKNGQVIASDESKPGLLRRAEEALGISENAINMQQGLTWPIAGTVAIVAYDPPLPARLDAGEPLAVTIDYQIADTEGLRVGAVPSARGQFVAGYTSNSLREIYKGSGRMTSTITFKKRTRIDKVCIRITKDNHYRMYVCEDVDAEWSN